MNKKAQFDVARKSIYWMLAGVVITMAVFAFAIILSSYQQKVTQVPPQLRAEVISLRFVNTPECFTYQDPVTGRIFPGVIDVTKFTQARMDQCYRTQNEQGFKEFNFGLALRTSASIFSVSKHRRASHCFTSLSSSFLGIA